VSYDLFNHQIAAEPRLLAGSALLWWDMQTGKTRACLHAFDQLWQTGGPRRLVVICPAYAKATWLNEMEVMGLGLPVLTLSGITKRRFDPMEPALVLESGLPCVVITSWDVIDAWLPHLLRFVSHAVVVLDESHEHAVNPATKRYKAVRRVAAFADRVWALTGTIYRKTALDIYWQGRLVGGFSDLPAASFGQAYCVKRFNPFHGHSGAMEYRGLKPGVEDQLVSLIPNLLRVREEDCFDVPEKRRVDRWVDVGNGYKGGENEANMEEARSRLVPLKVRRTLEFINDIPQRPLVVFGWHQAFVEAVAASIPGSAYVTGNTPVVARARIQRDFAAGRITVLVANLKAFGLSVSLARANHIVFGEVHWSETDHRQAEGRIRGPAQKSPHTTWTYLMVKNSIDSYVWNNKLNKGKAMDRLDSAVGRAYISTGR
jgi:hypothetical protein